MHPLVARVARAFGYDDQERPASPRPEEQATMLIHPGYWEAMDAERATSPAWDASEAEWITWLTATDAGHDLAVPFGPDHPEWQDWLTLLETTPDDDPWQRLGEWEHAHAHELER